MAFTVKNFIDPVTGHPRYNLDQTLRGGSQGVDTQLLQVLFNLLYFDLQPAAARFGFVPPGERLVEDGIVGTNTKVFAAHFTEHARKSTNLVNLAEHPEAAGIDPMHKPGELSPRLKSRYFIDALNIFCSSLSAQLGNDRYRTLASDPTVPLRLRNALKTVKTTASKYQFGG